MDRGSSNSSATLNGRHSIEGGTSLLWVLCKGVYGTVGDKVYLSEQTE